MPDTNFNGRNTRIARSVRKLSFVPRFGNKAIILIKKSTQLIIVLIHLHHQQPYKSYHLRCDNHKKIHYIPCISQV